MSKVQPLALVPIQAAEGQPRHEDDTPTRVRVALEFLAHLTFKTASRAAGCSVGVVEIAGQKLTSSEEVAQHAAHDMLSDYFAGRLKPDYYERRQERREDNDADPCPAPDDNLLPQESSRLVNCISCYPNPPKRDCVFCNGHGQVLVTPVAGR